MVISVNIYIIDLIISVCILEVLVEGRVSQNIYLGPSFHFMTKKRVTFCHFFQYKFLHFIK